MLNDNDLIRRGDLKDLLLKRSFFPAIVAASLKEIPAVDAVELPRGKVGEFVMLDNGYGEETAMIKAIAVTDEGLRYCFRFKSIPVDSPKIMRIMSREETEKWWEDFERERKDDVEVVRCKDCRHRGILYGNHLCQHPKAILSQVTDDDFCSYGERKYNEID